MKRPLASIIIPARDEEANLARCLEAINGQDTGFEYEVIVVDSGSRDKTAQVAESMGATVIEIGRDSFQHGRTRQMAAERSRGEYVVCLVADAVPADSRWLGKLVEASSGEGVAGAYSRQVPREGAGPIEAHRLEHRGSFRLEPRIAEIKDMDFWAMTPKQRLDFCEFDDVSACRRRSVMDRFPIPEVDWAEDLLWAKKVLLAGYKIAYEPESVVRHSHKDDLAHAFKRGYLDQTVVKEFFGLIFFDSARALAKGYALMAAERSRVIAGRSRGPAARARTTGADAVLLASQLAGNYAASRDVKTGHAVHDLTSIMSKRRASRVSRSGSIMKTRFVLDADGRPTLFMNPDAHASARLRIPEGGRLRFGAALNPECRPHRKGPVRFIAAVGQEPLWDRWIGPGARGAAPKWEEADVDLSKWAGKEVTLSLITRARDTSHAWAGWGNPRVMAERLSGIDLIYNRALETIREKAMGKPLRRP